MKEAFETLREFFVGAGYSVFAAGCVLAAVGPGVLLDDYQRLYFLVIADYIRLA
jgi:hypothetical protein